MSEPSQSGTKICPRCAETIKFKALVCRYCGFEYENLAATKLPDAPHPLTTQGASPTPPRVKPRKPNAFGQGCAVIIGLLLLLVFIGQCSSDNSADPVASPSADLGSPVKLPPSIRGEKLVKAAQSEIQAVQSAIKPPPEAPTTLFVRSWNWGEEYSHVIAEGQVKNQSSEAIDNLMAVVTFMDKNGDVITSDDALVDFRPLLAGQTTPFKVIATYNPEMKTANLRFRTFGGQEIEYTQKKNYKEDDKYVSQKRLVKLVQGDLNFLGYYKGKSDGILSNKTEYAIKNFQTKYGIKVDGKPSVDLAASTRVATLHEPIKPTS